MQGNKEAGGLKKVQADEDPAALTAAAASDATLTTTFTTTSGHVLTISEFISRFDETAKMRLHNMNQKLKDLELQMEALETEMSKADGSTWGSSSNPA